MDLIHQDNHGDHELAVYDTTELYGERGNFRILQFSNSAVQGALDLNEPERILFEYPRAILHLMQINQPTYQDVFLIGHGIGTIPKHCSDCRIKIAEIDERVAALSRQYFYYDQDNVTIGDGRQLLEDEPSHNYDYLILDAFTEKGTPRHLISQSFFQVAADKLRSDGAILMNLFGKGAHDTLIEAIYTTLCGQFSNCKAFILSSEDSNDVRNIILMGSNQPIAYHSRSMAGFQEVTLDKGYTLYD